MLLRLGVLRRVRVLLLGWGLLRRRAVGWRGHVPRSSALLVAQHGEELLGHEGASARSGSPRCGSKDVTELRLHRPAPRCVKEASRSKESGWVGIG